MPRLIIPRILILFFAAFASFKSTAQCNFTFDVQVNNCNPNALDVQVYLDVLTQDSVVLTIPNTTIYSVVTDSTWLSFQLDSSVDSIIVVGYPDNCQRVYVFPEWTGDFDADFQITDTSTCLAWNPHVLATNPSGGWQYPNASYYTTLDYPDGSRIVGDTFDVVEGGHILFYTDALDCWQADTIVIESYDAPVDFEIITTASNCDSTMASGTATLQITQGNGPFAEVWFDAQMNQIAAGLTSLQDLPPGDYFFQLLTGDCTAIKPFTIEGEEVIFTGPPDLTLDCGVSQVTAQVIIPNQTPDHIVTWYDSSFNVLGNALTQDITLAGTYYVEVSYLLCSTIDAFLVLDGLGLPDVSVVVDSMACGDSTTCVNINVVGDPSNFTYEWNYPSAPNIQNPCDVPVGTHTVTVTDLITGCFAELPLTVLPAGNIFVSTLISATSCPLASDGAIRNLIFGGAPPYTIDWIGGTTQDSILTGLASGTYNYTITDANNCQKDVQAFVPVADSMIHNIIVTCANNDSLGAVLFQHPIPVGQGFTFAWNGGNTSNEGYIENLETGIYQFTVTNIAGTCVEEYEVAICYDSLNIVSNLQVCRGDSIELNATAIGGMTFQGWANPAFNEIDCDACPSVFVSPDYSKSYFAVYEENANGRIHFWEFSVGVTFGCVWPGDVDSSLMVDHFDLLPLCLSLGSTGPARSEMDIDWYGHAATDWLQFIPGYNVDEKNADCDGNGIVELIDTAAIIQNWGLDRKSLNNPNAHSMINGVPMFLDIDTISGPGLTLNIPFVVGTMDSMANNVYGIAFSINFDPELVVDNGAYFSPSDSWLSNGSPEMAIVQKEFSDQGRLDVAISRINQTNASGFGAIADFIIIMEDDILFQQSSGSSRAGAVPFEFSISNVKMINAAGKEIATSTRIDTAFVLDTGVGTTNYDLESAVRVFPNPIDGAATLNVISDLNLKRYQFFDIHGRLLSHGTFDNSSIPMPNAVPGFYHLRLVTSDDLIIIKKVIVH